MFHIDLEFFSHKKVGPEGEKNGFGMVILLHKNKHFLKIKSSNQNKQWTVASK